MMPCPAVHRFAIRPLQKTLGDNINIKTIPKSGIFKKSESTSPKTLNSLWEHV